MTGPDTLVERLHKTARDAPLHADRQWMIVARGALREAAAELSARRERCDTQREHIRKQTDDIMTLGKLVYASETETWQARAEALQERLDLELDAYAKDHDMAVLRAARDEAVAALEAMNCPRPCNARPDDFTVGDCVSAGECGCGNARSLTQAGKENG